MFLCMSNFSVTHAVPCTVTVWIRVLTRQEEGLLCQVHFSLQLFVSKFQLLCTRWSSRRIPLGPLVSQNGFQGSCWGQLLSWLLRLPLALKQLGRLLTHVVMSMSIFSLFFSRILILLISLAPLSGQALVIGAERWTSASPTMSG